MRKTSPNLSGASPRGITEQDVWAAADALLLEGARPTIERVRQHIGRGSPNTVSPHLDNWFARLGARISDPLAFRAPPDVPEPVLQAARHFWESALALARGEADVRARAAEAERDAAVLEAQALRSRADTAEATLQALRLAQAGAEAAHAERSQALQREAARLAAEHAASTTQLKTQLAAQAETHRADLAAAVERAVQAERRAAADMDRERQARARAEQIARETRQQAELTLADERARAQAELVAQVQSYSRLEAQAQVLRDRVGQMEADMRRVRLRDRSDKSRAVASPLARLRERGRG